MPRQTRAGPCPRQELNLVFDLRKVVCASVTLRGQRSEPNRESPARELNPVSRLRKPPCVRHTRGERVRVPLPGVEPGLRPSEGRVPSVTRQGQGRSTLPSDKSATSAQTGCKDLNPVREFWRLAALPGAHPSSWPRQVVDAWSCIYICNVVNRFPISNVSSNPPARAGAEGKGFEPSSPFRGNRLSRAARQTGIRLPSVRVDRRGVEPRFPVQSRCRTLGPAARCKNKLEIARTFTPSSARESNSIPLITEVCCGNTRRPVG